MQINTMSYKELVAAAADKGLEKAHQVKKESLIEFLTSLQKEVKVKREAKQPDPRILEMAGGEHTRREIAKALGLKYSDVYFALKKAGLDAKAAKKPRAVEVQD